MPTYATATDYAEYKGVPDDYDAAERARINAGLLNAQDDIGLAVRFSVYDPDDADVQTALARATCAQFDFAEETGDGGTGAALLYQSVRIGSVSLTRNDQNGTQATASQVQYASKALTILANAGFISGVVYVA